ncbi:MULTISPECIES: XRE family transcriptional regulator [Psychrobacter]|uniref:XRE family transcriptional regulator n=1 Tax=Psychrobacter TaxID=497 RepID=UPI000B422083|nr:LexA family transcriptional regulator [Psychrobacter immobilis]
MSTLAERVKLARDRLNLSQQDVADATGMSQPSYYKIEKGLTKRTTYINELAKVFEVNVDWLANGSGEMLSGAANKAKDTKSTGNEAVTNSKIELARILEAGSVSTDDSDDDMVSIPIYDLYFCCGDGNGSCEFENIKGYRKLPPSFFKDRNIRPEDFKLICAINDSNYPYIKDGDEVGIVITDREVKDGEYYAILLDGDRMIKQIFREAGGSYRLSSFNKAYPDKVVTPEHNESLIIAGRQVYRAG